MQKNNNIKKTSKIRKSDATTITGRIMTLVQGFVAFVRFHFSETTRSDFEKKSIWRNEDMLEFVAVQIDKQLCWLLKDSEKKTPTSKQ